MNNASSLVGAPLGRTMLRLSIPGVIGALLFASIGLVEASFLSAAGADALAAAAVVFPLIMLAAMLSAGAIGGAISGRTARAMGAGDQEEASAVLISAVLIAVVGGVLMWALVRQFGPLLYVFASDSPQVIKAANLYASIVFPAIPLFWLVNMLCSVMRGAADLVRPAIVAAVMLVSYAIYAWLLIPEADSRLDTDTAVAAAARAIVLSYLTSLALSVYFILRKDQPVRFKLRAFKLRSLVAVLKQGLLAGSQSAMTITYALVTTVVFSRFGTEWLAGFGLAVRLELIMVPVIFGMGASLISIVGAYVGAGQREKAISIAWRGVVINAVVVGAIGLVFALFPEIWCNRVGSDINVINHCAASLRTISPTYAFFALGLGCYFASQGLNTLMYPVLGALLRLLIVTSGLFWLNSQTDPSIALKLVAFAVVIYGLVVVVGLATGPWRRKA